MYCFINKYKLYSLLKGIILSSVILMHISCVNKTSRTLKVCNNILLSSGLPVVIQSERDIPVVGQADVVVAGGGIAGVAAALSAAEKGLSVILIETRNYFGQELTATYNCGAASGVAGPSSHLTKALLKELTDKSILSLDYINPEALRSFLLGKINGQPNIKVYLYSMPTGAVLERERVKGVVFNSRDGRQIILAKTVVDATEDGRIATAAGAKMVRQFTGDRIARRFISVRLPESLPQGSFPMDKSLGLVDDQVIIHKGYIELAVRAQIKENPAFDLSRIQEVTLEKSFNLKDKLEDRGIILDNFTPAPETWIDEMPVVRCLRQLNREEITSNDFSDIAVIQPEGIDGLLIAGRTVEESFQSASLQDLLSIGEFAGRSAASMAAETRNFVKVSSISASLTKTSERINVCELLEGIDPNMEYPRILQNATELPVLGEYDVLVVGGGTSGAIAAISAARNGARTAVIEILPNLGGISTNRVNGYYWGSPWKSLLRQELGDRIYLKKSTGGGPLEKVGFSGEDKKYALQDLALREGVKIYYQSLASGAVVEGNRVKGVVVENSSGRHILMADVVIDATGHAGIAVAAGADFVKGRSTDGFLHELEHGPLRDPTDLTDISTSYLKFPSSSISMNIRESRRISGDYVVTFDDVIHERVFEDIVCRWRCNYDTHFPTSANQSDLAQDWVAILGLWRRPILGSIPYRSILPKGLDNILVAGMAYSTDHDALIAARMQPDLEHLGEAAGIAAAMSSKFNITPRKLPVEQLQRELVHSGILRNEDVPSQNITEGPSAEVLHRQDFWREEREKQFPASKEVRKPSLEDFVSQLGTEKALEAMVQLYLAGEKSIPLLRPLLSLKNEQIFLDKSPSNVKFSDPPDLSEYRRMQEEVAVLLGLLGDRSVVPVLLDFIKERNTRRFEYTLPQASSRPSLPLYWTSVILLGRFGEEKAVPAMLELLALSPSPEELKMLKRSAYGLDMFKSADITTPTLASFIIVSLGRIGDSKAADAIRPFLTVSGQLDISSENLDFETKWGLQTNAAWALAKMGDFSGVPVLINLLNDDQAMVRNYAKNLLESITGQQLGSEPETWEKWWQSRN